MPPISAATSPSARRLIRFPKVPFPPSLVQIPNPILAASAAHRNTPADIFEFVLRLVLGATLVLISRSRSFPFLGFSVSIFSIGTVRIDFVKKFSFRVLFHNILSKVTSFSEVFVHLTQFWEFRGEMLEFYISESTFFLKRVLVIL